MVCASARFAAKKWERRGSRVDGWEVPWSALGPEPRSGG